MMYSTDAGSITEPKACINGNGNITTGKSYIMDNNKSIVDWKTYIIATLLNK